MQQPGGGFYGGDDQNPFAGADVGGFAEDAAPAAVPAMMNFYDGGGYDDDYDDMANVVLAQPPPLPGATMDVELGSGDASAEDVAAAKEAAEAAAREAAEAAEEAAEMSKYYFWNLEYYRRYFNVGPRDVGLRMGRSFLPYPVSFLEFVQDNPDAYGPLWIAASLVLAISFSSNLVSLILDPTQAVFSFAVIPVGFVVVYGYLACVSFVTWGMCRGPMELPDVGLLQVLDLFGYGLTPLVPAVVLCSYGWWWSRCFFLLLGGAVSTAFLVTNLIPVARRSWKYGSPLLLGVALVHVLLTLLLVAFYLYLSIAGVPDVASDIESN
jgi:hypothetical protein